MKKTIKMAVNLTEVNTREVEIDFPEEAKFFHKNDDGRFFPEGDIVFAIVPRYKTNPTQTYMLYRISRGTMKYNDFVPTKDMRQDYWLKDTFRQQALNLIKMPYSNWDGWEEISKETFIHWRDTLLAFDLEPQI